MKATTSLIGAVLAVVSTVRIMLESNGSETRERRGKAESWDELF